MQWIDDFDFFLFDFDGLLVHTEPFHFQAYRDALSDRGFVLDWSFNDFCSYAHLGSNFLRDALYAQLSGFQESLPSWETFYKEKQQAYLSLIANKMIDLMPGVGTLLDHLNEKKINHCVVTHSVMQQVQLIKAKQPKLQQIPHWITREDYNQPKPSPDGYLCAIERFGKAAKRIIGFEDSFRGLKALCDTPALPVLICANDHPQLEGIMPERAIHFESFDQLLASATLS